MLPNPSQVPESFEERLNAHPELRAKFEVLLSVVENAQGDLIRADAAEQRVIEEIRQLGQVALQNWATRQEQQQSEAFSQENPTANRSGAEGVRGNLPPAHFLKKNSIGTADSDASKF
jgi:hypothetical protein